MTPSRPGLYVFLFTFLALLYSVTVPLFEGNDESWHYAYVRHIAEGKGLPRQPPEQYPHLARQEASQPPLYYLLAAALTRWVPQEDLPALYARENPYPTVLPVAYRDNQNHYVHTDAERFPYRGRRWRFAWLACSPSFSVPGRSGGRTAWPGNCSRRRNGWRRGRR
jgi:hypothetical protein